MAELVDATDSKSVSLRRVSVQVGLGVPFKKKLFNFSQLLLLPNYHNHILLLKNNLKQTRN